ncbi:MAG: ATP-binding protein [Saprospiraceae bacterium]
MKRKLLEILRQRIENEPRRFINVLYGPRQVGKTTMVKQLLEGSKFPSHYATADAVTPVQSGWISQQWDIARLKNQSSYTGECILVLDEIQKIHNWSEQVKFEWDKDSSGTNGLKIILLGSSRLLLQQGLTESLTGRFEAMYVPHWNYSEMKELDGMTVDEFIWFGGYPGAAAIRQDEVRWKAYMQTSIIESSISRDILMLTRVDKPALIRQLFDLGCAYSGQILSLNKIIGQLHDAGNTTTLSHYLNLLDQAGLLSGLGKFSPNIIRQRSSSPKFQVQNMGLKSALEPFTFNEVKQDTAKWGRWVESAIGAHLINECIASGYRLFYWRNRNDEIDFVLEGNNKVIGIEVKTSSTSSTSGMGEFKNQFNPDKVILIGPSGIEVEEFLEMEVKSLVS